VPGYSYVSDAELLSAYRATTWRVETPGGALTLRLGDTVEALPATAIITAYNPASEKQSDEENVAANAKLLRDLERAGGTWLHAVGHDTEPGAAEWTEPGFAVSGLDLAHAVALGERYGQNAIVWIDERGNSALVVTRSGFCGCDVGQRL
jgi:hypothetical protein